MLHYSYVRSICDGWCNILYEYEGSGIAVLLLLVFCRLYYKCMYDITIVCL